MQRFYRMHHHGGVAITSAVNFRQHVVHGFFKVYIEIKLKYRMYSYFFLVVVFKITDEKQLE